LYDYFRGRIIFQIFKLESWNPAMPGLEYWNTGILEYWNTGILEYWNIGILEYWNTGILEYWNSI